jgi:RNA polymerase sigma factor (sigma-70 family)
VKSTSAERQGPRLAPEDDATRKRVAVETYARNETSLRRTASRYSLCPDDAEDALQRGLEILLRKAPSEDPRELVKWTQTVIKHEALAIRRERERFLAGPAAAPARADAEDWVSLVPAKSAGPAERAERREAIARSREALQTLKPQELRALTLLAEGYSYAEIGAITQWSHTKVNRLLAEGRERFRRMVARGEDGSRCAEVRPMLSAFCDGEANAEQVATLREHLRACGHCRATLRAYRAAPAAAAALVPVLPLHRSLWERAHDAVAGAVARFGGGKGEAVSQVAVGSGASGAGVATLAKVAAVCIGAAGGAAACVAGGIVPAPLDLGSERPRLERQVVDAPAPEPTPQVAYEPAPAPEPEPDRKPSSERQKAPAAAEPLAAEPAPASSDGAVEYAPPPEPVAEPAPVEAPASAGSPAGEFGP